MSKKNHADHLLCRTWLKNEVLFSKAWADLSGKAPQVYMILMSYREVLRPPRGSSKRERQEWEYPVVNARDLVLTYKQAESFGYTKRMFTHAIDSLVEHGFIDIVRHGGGLEHMPTKYGISERWRKWGEPGFKEAKREKNRNGFCSKGFHKQNVGSGINDIEHLCHGHGKE